MSLVESLTKTNLLLVADMKSGIQSIQNELSSIPLENIRNEQLQNFGNLSAKIEALEKDFTELKDIVMKRSYQNFKIDPKIFGSVESLYVSDQKKSLDQHETDFEQSCSRQHC